MKKVKTLSGVLVLLFLVAGFSDSVSANPPEGVTPPSEEQREQFKKERMKTNEERGKRISEELGLSEKEAIAFSTVLKKHDEKRAEMGQSMGDLVRDLYSALEEKDEGRLKTILGRMENNHKAMQALRDEEREDLKRVLTTEQQAKLVLFQIRRDMRMMEKEGEKPVQRRRYPKEGLE